MIRSLRKGADIICAGLEQSAQGQPSWRLHANSKISLSSAYCFDGKWELLDDSVDCWSRVWKAQDHMRQSLTFWFARHGQLLFQELLHQRQIITSLTCELFPTLVDSNCMPYSSAHMPGRCGLIFSIHHVCKSFLAIKVLLGFIKI